MESPHTRTTFQDILEDNMDDDPGSHFLADATGEPYECRFGMWDDSDDDDEEDDAYQLNPHIIDFTLFSDAARRAKETQRPLSPQWDRLIQSQQGAYERTLERTASYPITVQRPRFLEDLPDLTPDNSPQFKNTRLHPSIPSDKLSMPPPARPRPLSHPTSLHIRFEPDYGISKDEDDLNSLYLPDSAFPYKRLAQIPVPRPGLHGSHTLSGHSHSWRRPSFELPTVCEEGEPVGTLQGDEGAEGQDEMNSRGRGRRRSH